MPDNEYSCPFCRATIPLDDVNVAKDVALCRSCGRTTAFSSIRDTEEIAQERLDRPPRSVRVESGRGSAVSIRYHRMSPVLLFLIPFAALWSGGAMYGIFGEQIRKGKFNLELSLFGIPFFIGTLILLAVIFYLLFGKWVITLDRGQGSVFVGLGSLGWTRRFSYNRETLVSLCMTSAKVNDRPLKGIQVRTDEKDFVFGAFIQEDAKRFIAAAILREVGR